MDKSLEHYIELKNKCITFKEQTLNAKDANEYLYYTILELNRYKDMVQDVFNYTEKHLNSHEANEIEDIIRQWIC